MSYIPIYINKFEYDACVNYSKNSIGNQRDLSFGEKGENRSNKEMYDNTLQGKLGEVAFKKYIDITEFTGGELDFEVYPRGQWDDGVDMRINDLTIDIKSVKHISKWFLLEVNKVSSVNSQVFVITSVRDCDGCGVYVDLKGFCSKNKMLNKPILNKGECIPNTNCKLKTDNYSMLIQDLCRDWDLLLNSARQ